MTRVRPSAVLTTVVVLLVLAVAGATRWAPPPVALASGAGGTSAGVVPVSSTTLACPDASAPDSGSPTDVTLVAPVLAAVSAGTTQPADGGSAAGGSAAGGSVAGDATVTSLDPGASPLLTLDAHGPAATTAVTSADAGPLTVRTVGSLAPGLSATQVSTVGAGDATGVAAAYCSAPSTESWFVGLGTELGHQPVLTLANVDEVVAEVDVSVYGPEGLLDLANLRGVVVPANAAVTYPLDTLAPDLTELAVHVEVRSGRVAPGIRDTWVEGLDSLGVDWVPTSVAPSTRVVVPGARGGGGVRVLQLLAPGELDTLVHVRLLTATGAIVPTSVEQIELTAGAVRSVDLAEALGADVVAIELTADEPVIAGLRTVSPVTGPRDLEYTAGADPLTGPAILPDARSGGGWASRLMLTADDGASAPDPSAGVPASPSATPSTDAATSAAAVVIQYLDSTTGEVLATHRETIPAGSTVDLVLSVGSDDTELTRFTVVVTPISGVVYGAVQLSLAGGTSAGLTELPLFSPTLLVDVPYVRQDLGTGLRPRD